jgi:hypothetical protein
MSTRVRRSRAIVKLDRLTRTVADQARTHCPFWLVIVQRLIENGEKSDEESGQEGVQHNVKHRDLDYRYP